MTQEIAISKQGKNVLTETDPNSFIFHSAYNSFKILYQGTTAVTVNGGTTWYNFAHNSPLGTTTCMSVFMQFPDGKVTQASYAGSNFEANSYNNASSGADGHSAGIALWDNTNIWFSCGFAPVYTINFSWFIYEAGL